MSKAKDGHTRADMYGAGTVGRPALHWTERSWARHYQHGDFNEGLCWTPVVGDAVGPSIKLPWLDRGAGRVKQLKLRRWLYCVVMVDTVGRAQPQWEDVVIPGEQCNPECVNPWHQQITDRRSAGLKRGAMFKDRYAAEAAAESKNVAGEETMQAVMEHWYPLFCVERLFAPMGGGVWALDDRYPADIRDHMQDRYDKEFGQRYARFTKWIAAHPRDLKHSRQAYDTWTKADPTIEHAIDKFDLHDLVDRALKRGAWTPLLEE